MKKLQLKRSKPSWLAGVVAVVFVASIGTYVLLRSHAATPAAATSEAELGTLSGTTKTNDDNSASGGKSITFGTAVVHQILDVYPSPSTQTLSAALAAADDGAIIKVHAGSYGHPIIAGINHSATNPVNITAAGDGTATFTGFTLRNSVAGTSSGTATSGLSFSNLTITDPTYSIDGIRIEDNTSNIDVGNVTITSARRGIYIIGCAGSSSCPVGSWPQNIKVHDSNISGTKSDLDAIASGHNISYLNNVIHDPLRTSACGGSGQPSCDHVDGIQVAAVDSIRISGNTFTNPSGGQYPDGGPYPSQGIIVGRADPFDAVQSVSNVEISNNLIYKWLGTGIIVSGTSNVSIVNNTVVDDASGAQDFVTSVKDPTAASSSGSGTRGGTTADWENPGLAVWNNIFGKTNITKTGLATDFYPDFEVSNIVQSDQGLGQHGNSTYTSAASLFGNLTTYTLNSTSPARGSGVNTTKNNVATPAVDRAGKTRTNPPDVGAYQF